MLITNTLIGNFRMYTHLYTESMNTNYIAGVYEDSNSQKDYITAVEADGDKFTENGIFAKIQVPENMKVVNIISQRFTSKEFEVLVTTVKKGGIYTNYLIDLADNESVFEPLFESSSTPILIADPDDLSPLLVFGVDKKGPMKAVAASLHQIQKNKFDTNMTNEYKYVISGIGLRGVHTSAFLALHKNMHAVLALHVKNLEGTRNSIIFYNIVDNQVLASADLPAKIGPVIFSELVDGIGSDMIYVSEENGKYFLNIHKNIIFTAEEEKEFRKEQNFKKFLDEKDNETEDIFEESIKLDLTEFSSFGTPVLSTADHIPSGIFLSNSGKKQINLIFEENHKFTLRTFEFNFYNSDYQLVLSENQLLDHNEGITSISFTEIDNNNQECILINTSDNSLKLEKVTKNEDKNMYLNLLAMESSNQSYIPGTTFCIIYENNTKLVKGSLGPQTSYPSLQRHKFFGISSTKFFINFVLLKAPTKSKKTGFYNAISVIIPNTFSTFTFNGERWFRRSYFLDLQCGKTAIGVLIVLIAMPTIYHFLSYLRPYLLRRSKKDVDFADSTKKVFEAL